MLFYCLELEFPGESGLPPNVRLGCNPEIKRQSLQNFKRKCGLVSRLVSNHELLVSEETAGPMVFSLLMTFSSRSPDAPVVKATVGSECQMMAFLLSAFC